MKMVNCYTISKLTYYTFINAYSHPKCLFIDLIIANLVSGHYHTKMCRSNMKYSKLYLSLLLLLNWIVNIAYCPPKY